MTLQRRGRRQPVVERRGDRRVDPRHYKLRGEVAFHAPGELPNDGKVIDDVRQVRLTLTRDPAVSAATSTSALRERAGRSGRERHAAPAPARRRRSWTPLHRFAEDHRAKPDREHRAERADQ